MEISHNSEEGGGQYVNNDLRRMACQDLLVFFLSIPQGRNLVFECLLQSCRVLVVRRAFRVVCPAVVKYKLGICEKGLEIWILIRVELVLHRVEVCMFHQP